MLRSSRWVLHTGLGDVLARCHPVRYLAIFRDREAFFDSLKRGESTGSLTDYERRIFDLCKMKNVPTDILFSKYMNARELGKYRVLLVPSERVLTEEKAQAMAEFVRVGGNIIVEGASLRSAVLAKLCGVSVSNEALREVSHLKGIASPLESTELELTARLLPIKSSSATVLATANGEPAVFTYHSGQGKALAVALTRAPVEVIKKLVRFAGGPRPVELIGELEERVQSNVLTDGKRFIIAVYNPHFSERVSGTLDTSRLPAPEGAVLIDFEKGTRSEYQGKVPLDLEPYGFLFALVSSPKDFSLPEITAESPPLPPSSSTNPGVKFLRIREEKPVTTRREKERGKVYVGIFLASPPRGPLELGAKAMMNTLKKWDRLVVEYIHDDRPQTLSFYDVVVIPNMKRRARNMSESWQEHIRRYTRQGGGVLLVHHSVGYPATTPPPFPEVATAPDYVPIATMKVISRESLRKAYGKKAENPAFAQQLRATELKVGQEIQSTFADYIKLLPGPKGKVLLRSAVRGNRGGDAVLVVGEAGNGKVVLCGINIGCKTAKLDGKYSYEEVMGDAQSAILTNSIFWLAEK